MQPSSQPTSKPTNPTGQPSRQPTSQPIGHPTGHPSPKPTYFVIYNKTERYKAIDPTVFDVYGPSWLSNHRNWVSRKSEEVICDLSKYTGKKTAIFPACIDGHAVGGTGSSNKVGGNCPSIHCPVVAECVPTPHDTIDYIPPEEVTTLDSYTICTPADADVPVSFPYYGMDEGVPPLYTPITPVPLKVSGRVVGSINGRCELLGGAIVRAWQIDPFAAGKYTSLSEYLEVLESDPGGVKSPQDTFYSSKSPHKSSTFSPPLPLRDISCSARQTAHSGLYNFSTAMPPPYGPPRHIVFTVSMEGFETLTTRLYFDLDWRLQQLTTLGGDVYNQNVAAEAGSNRGGRGFSTDDDTFILTEKHIKTENITPLRPISFTKKFPGAIALDPRVRKVNFVKSPVLTNIAGAVNGHYEVTFDLVLKSSRSSDDMSISGTLSKPPASVDGLWMDSSGGKIKIETRGNVFIATEYPHARQWGTVSGYLSGDTIRGVDLSRSSSLAVVQPEGSFSDSLSSGAWTTAYSTGQILASDPYGNGRDKTTSSDELAIRWTGNGVVSANSLWSKIIDSSLAGYRYLKLQITRETGGYSYGKMVINEIEFFDGILAQRVVPSADQKMVGPRTPSPLVVSCSSFRDQESHCFKAFDGDKSANSSWVTSPTGNHKNKLDSPEHVLLDLGQGRSIQPTALRIVCDAGAAFPRGCPRTFTLLGSQDNVRFEVVTKKDLFDYDNEYSAAGGIKWNFFWEAPSGRPSGHKCGSCDSGPAFTCNIKAFDSSCSSSYCSIDGLCASPPSCRMGEYLESKFVGYTLPSFTCKPCPAGRFGNNSGLTTEYCSGLCAAGHYCSAGSDTPFQHECGSDRVYCPEGSSYPVTAGAGRATVGASAKTRHTDELCPLGYYCEHGVRHQCSVGRYGAAQGLQSHFCSGPCLAGEYCDAGSASPTLCDKGHFCPDGAVRYRCPAGTHGATSGLKDSRCSGQCPPGYFCAAGSSDRRATPCPGGTFGEAPGQTGPACEGKCAPGYYCPAGSANATAEDCGGPSVYCPEGSAAPLVVSLGYYSVEGPPAQRVAQRVCDAGFFCRDGERFSCPAGSFGAIEGQTTVFSYGGATDAPTAAPSSHSSSSTSGVSQVGVPTGQPTGQPTRQPTGQPSRQPTGQPTGQPSSHPSESIEKSRKYANASDPSSDAPADLGSFCSGFCSPGHYCPANSTSPTQVPCPEGSYGESPGLGNSACTAPCPPGHYCPLASISPTPCAGGLFGIATGLSEESCSGQCRPGHFCPAGSTSSKQYECGNATVYCPAGAALPTPVSTGFYSTGGEDPRTLTEQRVCEVGHYCKDGQRFSCPPGTFGSKEGLSTADCAGLCSPGYYCPLGTVNGTTYRCPAGRYGATSGLYSSACSGACSAGYYCPEASTAPTEVECGAATHDRNGARPTGYLVESEVDARPNRVFCPSASARPLITLPGYYSTGQTRSTRTAQAPCPMGSYCANGTKKDCPAGRYGRAERLEECSELCQEGHYCPPGSTSATARPCPVGRYGDSRGLAAASQCRPCTSVSDCPSEGLQRRPLQSDKGPGLW